MNTIVGALVDTADGTAFDRGSDRLAWCTRAGDYRREQDPRIVITDGGHDGPAVGEIVYLERAGDRIFCVGEVDAVPTLDVIVGDDLVELETTKYFSAELLRAPDETVLLRSVALTAWPARTAATPVRWFAGEINRRSGWQLDTFHTGILERAAEERYTRRYGDPIILRGWQDPDAPPATGWFDEYGGTPRGLTQSRGRVNPATGVWHGSGGSIISVR